MAPANTSCGSVTYTASTQGCLSGCSTAPTPAPTTSAAKPATPLHNPEWTTTKPKEAASEKGASTTVTPSAGSATDTGLGTSGRLRGKPKLDVDAVEGAVPASGEIEPTILKKKIAPAKLPEEEFEAPVESNKPIELKKSPKVEKVDELDFEFEKKATEGAQLQRPHTGVNLDAKIAWRNEPQRSRVPFHAKLAKATVTRRTIGTDSDWTPIVAKVTGTQFVKK